VTAPNGRTVLRRQTLAGVDVELGYGPEAYSVLVRRRQMKVAIFHRKTDETLQMLIQGQVQLLSFSCHVITSQQDWSRLAYIA
jgi:hypothetical protein